MSRIWLLAALTILASQTGTIPPKSEAPDQARLRFEVTVARSPYPARRNGRLIVVLGRPGQREPRLTIGRTGMNAPPVLGRDIAGFEPGFTAVIDESAAIFPLARLSDLQPGEYIVQALFDSNVDVRAVNAPGNLYSSPRLVKLDPLRSGSVKVKLTEEIPPEELPEETDYIKYVKIRSDLLSKFHGRPIYLRAGVIVPAGYAEEPERRYPLRVNIGGYGSKYSDVRALMRSGSAFRNAWLSDDAPRMILLHLDGDGPYGDSYQVNSANNGPYGDAVTRELIPHVEERFRGIGQPHARVLDGGSTGGWVSLALQVFYPDFFNGVWSFCPDAVDFRAFQLIDVYRDANAYVNEHGFERPSARDLDGEVRFTIRHECSMENAVGLGGSWAMSGEQWGAWNAVYGPKGEDGRPVPLWDPKSGAINREVIPHWEKYDLRKVLEGNWSALGPKLRGKIRIWVGEADDYFLNNAVHMLEEFLVAADPPYEGRIFYGPRKGHCWAGLTERELMKEMEAVIDRSKRQGRKRGKRSGKDALGRAGQVSR